VPDSWLDARLEARTSRVHGRGTFARAEIAESELVTVWEHRILDTDDEAPPGELWPRSDGTFVWVPANDPTAAEAFLNHSCDPNVWMADEVTLIARRAIAAGEELTADYALFELDPAWASQWRCRCGTACCRGAVSGRDFELPDLQQRYGRHFHPLLLQRIAKSRALPSTA
jgi:hypothetical protein